MRLVNQGFREWGIGLHGSGRTIEEARESIAKGYAFPQILYMPCGHKEWIESVKRVPSVNIPCPCGNPKHWIVKYDIPVPFIRRVLRFILRSFRKGGT